MNRDYFVIITCKKIYKYFLVIYHLLSYIKAYRKIENFAFNTVLFCTYFNKKPILFCTSKISELYFVAESTNFI